MCFLPEHPTASGSSLEESYVVSYLYIDHKLQRYVVSRSIDISDKELSIEPYLGIDPIPVQADADLIVPIKGSSTEPGGLLVFGGGMCQFIETIAPAAAGKRKKSISKREKPSKSSIEASHIITTSIPVERVVA